jgi:hypothetical protein
MIVFWEWWTIVIGSTAFAILCHALFDIGRYLTEVDGTGISTFIIGIYVISTSVAGWYAYVIQFRSQFIRKKSMLPLWYAVDSMLAIGMMGTLVGFIAGLEGFNNVDANSAAEIKKVIAEMAANMGVALITTLTGLVCSTVLKAQLVLIESRNRRLEPTELNSHE